MFNPLSEWNLTITLTASDIDVSNPITIPKELVEAKIFPRWGKIRCEAMQEPDSFVMVNLYCHHSNGTKGVAMKKDEHGNFKLYGWHSVLEGRSIKTGDVIGFWWDKYSGRLNLELLVIA
ncbi:unnamed protein product [Eruca vesicaria subsp. sativa]|uniref:TF-B3 domain-containing protein n=1 Tax=Eruca vesicaria subsp. sativa TaxID=29727 RepID=A0ABC8LW11_ERUVS|nr:unnamed protein product [Eruca vesicaria subsp. sativa]